MIALDSDRAELQTQSRVHVPHQFAMVGQGPGKLQVGGLDTLHGLPGGFALHLPAHAVRRLRQAAKAGSDRIKGGIAEQGMLLPVDEAGAILKFERFRQRIRRRQSPGVAPEFAVIAPVEQVVEDDEVARLVVFPCHPFVVTGD